MAVRSPGGHPGAVFESLADVATASEWVYLLVLLIAALDAVFPLVPSEATVIAAAALAGTGELVLAFVLIAGASGAVIGDNIAYALGRAGQGLLLRRLLGSPRWGRRVGRAEEQLRQRGGTIIAVSRFVPAGRTATMLAAGILGLRWRRFIRYDVLAGVLWATYASAVGWIGGRTLADRPLHGLLLAFAVAAALVLAIEAGRRWARRTRETLATDKREQRQWVVLLSFELGAAAVFVIAVFATGIQWFLLPAGVCAPLAVMVTFVCLALRSDTNAERAVAPQPSTANRSAVARPRRARLATT
jgi:membrane-associated protein